MTSEKISEETLKEICTPICQSLQFNSSSHNFISSDTSSLTVKLDIFTYITLIAFWLLFMYFILFDFVKLFKKFK